MLTRDEAEQLASKILKYSTFPECSIEVQGAETLNIRFANNGVTTSGFVTGRAITIASTREARTGVASTDQTGDDALRAAVKRSEEMAALSPVNPERMPPLGKQEYPDADHFDEASAAARGEVLVPQIRAVIDRAVRDKFVAAGFFERSAAGRAVANKAGLFGYSRSTDANLTATVRTADGKSSGWAGRPAVRIGEIDGAEVAERAAGKCARWRNPVRLEPGRYTVVLEPNAVCNLVGFLGGAAMSARDAEQGNSFLSRKGGGTLTGEKLFPEAITLRSDPFEPRLVSAPWSGGEDPLPTRKLTWIDRGVVRNLYYDRYWAGKKGKSATPFASSLVLEGGDASLEELIATVQRGLLVTRLWYIRELNPRTLQLTGLTRDGLFLIEDGKIARPAMNFRFNESPVRMLENVRKLGRAERAESFEGGSMIVPPLVADSFNFASVSDAV
ncbi:MAG TPA: TldD/PmbA family protein [Bryobacteraceae bacterium]|nr:TldD/PmbA family protein [Bryobacteraceae bacterium]